MPTKKRLASESGFAPLVLVLAVAIFAGLGTTAATQIRSITNYPVTENPAVLGDLTAETSTSEKLTDEEYQKLLELKKQELKVKEELMLKEKAKKKEELRKKEEKTKIELERKKDLYSKQQELRKKAELQKAEKLRESSSEAELEDEELEALEKQLSELQLQLKDSDNQNVVLEQNYGDLKLKYKYVNGKLKVTAKAENGAEIEVDDPEVNALKTQLEQTLSSSKSLNVATSGGNLLIGKNKIKARTNGVVSVDPNTNQLLITTKKGQKQVTVLPDAAVQNLYSKQILSEIEFEKDSEEGSGDSIIELQDRDDEVVYKVKGKKEHKLLGLLPVKTDTTAFVSAESGDLVAKEESLFSRFIDLLSF